MAGRRRRAAGPGSPPVGCAQGTVRRNSPRRPDAIHASSRNDPRSNPAPALGRELLAAVRRVRGVPDPDQHAVAPPRVAGAPKHWRLRLRQLERPRGAELARNSRCHEYRQCWKFWARVVDTLAPQRPRRPPPGDAPTPGNARRAARAILRVDDCPSRANYYFKPVMMGASVYSRRVELRVSADDKRSRVPGRSYWDAVPGGMRWQG